MSPEEHHLITGLFDRIGQNANQQRDPEAERLIADQVQAMPHAAYTMAQTIIMQDQALEQAAARISALENSAARNRASVPPTGGFLPRDPVQPNTELPPSPWGDDRRSRTADGAPGVSAVQAPAGGRGALGSGFGGGGFLAGAAQAAAGVAGGMLLAEAARSMFGGGAAHAAATPPAPASASDTASTFSGSDGDNASGGADSGGVGGFFDRLWGGGNNDTSPTQAFQDQEDDQPSDDDTDWDDSGDDDTGDDWA